ASSSGGSGVTSNIGGSCAGGSGGSSNHGGSSAGGSGGSSTGGTGGTPPIDQAPYTNDDCTDADGPETTVTSSETGAFVDSSDWHEGWTNFSTDSSGVDCSGTLSDLPIESDG